MPLSNSEVDRVGGRIRHAVVAREVPASEDLAVLEEFRAEYFPLVLGIHEILQGIEASLRSALTHLFDQLQDTIRSYGLDESILMSVASRPKTASAILAKLGRETVRLSQMQDIAGGRIIVPSREIQDDVVAMLADAHVELIGAEPVRITDTRAEGEPHGYRAVHVVILVEGRPVEVQVRTPAEQLWAQLVEAIDRASGWDLKHGTGPQEWLAWFIEISDAFFRVGLGEVVTDSPPPPHALEGVDWPWPFS